VVTKFLETYFALIHEKRARDIQPRESIEIPTALSVLRRETRMTREELAERLKSNPSKLAYLETVGHANETQLLILIGIAEEYAMPNLAQYFESKRLLYCAAHGGKGRNRRI
jgi:hypothetical protein